jgi:hypothetical protein
VAFCRVSYHDIEGIEHSVEVMAASLYEAVAMAVSRFRRDEGWGLCPPGPGCEFQVRVLPESPMTYTVALSKVESYALHGTAKGPKSILHKERLRELLRLNRE